jgi:hypothetical protein
MATISNNNGQQPAGPWGLPPEMDKSILNKLDGRDLVAVGRTNKAFHDYILLPPYSIIIDNVARASLRWMGTLLPWVTDQVNGYGEVVSTRKMFLAGP